METLSEQLIQAHLLRETNQLQAAHDALRRLYLLKLDLEQAKHHAAMTTRYRLSEQKIKWQIRRRYCTITWRKWWMNIYLINRY